MAVKKIESKTKLHSMSVMELNDLVRQMEEKFGVSAAAMSINELNDRVGQMKAVFDLPDDAMRSLSAARLELLAVLKARAEEATQEVAAVQEINRCSNSMVRNMDIALAQLQRSTDKLLGVM